ncbi:MAG TPA: acyl-CoA dehydrogenase [Steroidobacteraceae bacterium]|nr:acyl-CoA dehydrogenase [Steroidobacteraceae bacterium]
MDFAYSDEQRALREIAGRLLDERFTDEFRRLFARSGAAYDEELWAALAQSGLLGTAIDPEHGGSGLGLTGLSLLLEEQGRTLAAVPLFATLVLGARPLERFGTPAQRGLLHEVLAGGALLSAALEEAGETFGAPRTRADPAAGGWRVNGVKTCVPYAAQARALLVSVCTPDEPARLLLIDSGAPGLTVEDQHSSSGEPQGRVSFAAVPVSDRDWLGQGAGPLQWLIDQARVAQAAWQLGLLREALRRAAAYVTERRQFGRPVGSFQAVQHRLADCFIDLEALHSAYLRAVWALDAGQEASAAALSAHCWAVQAGQRISHAVQHVHGGLGADLEYPIHAYYLRSKQLGLALGGALPALAQLGAQLAAGRVAPFTASGDAHA